MQAQQEAGHYTPKETKTLWFMNSTGVCVAAGILQGRGLMEKLIHT